MIDDPKGGNIHLSTHEVKTMAKATLTFKFDRETKGAVRYKEDAPDGKELIGQLYVRKSGLVIHKVGNESVPTEITVTVEAK